MLDGLLAAVPEQRITWISRLAPRLFRQVLDLCRGHQGRLNFSDALMALSCRELGIRVMMSFDGDFDDVSWLARMHDPATIAHLIQQASDR